MMEPRTHETLDLHQKYFAAKEREPAIKTGEFLFIELCKTNKWECTKLDPPSKKGEANKPRSSDFLVQTPKCKFITECKDIESEERILGKGCSFTLGENIVKKIHGSKKQIKKSQEEHNLPTLLVLYDASRLGRTDPTHIRKAMFGDMKMSLKTGKIFHDQNANFHECKNTSFSAVASLNTFNPFNPSLEVHHNSFAKVPFEEGIFEGQDLYEHFYQIEYQEIA